MKKRKHRIVVEITCPDPCTEQQAACILQFILKDQGLFQPFDLRQGLHYFECKQFSKVFSAEFRKRVIDRGLS